MYAIRSYYDRISDLIFDEIGRAPGPFGVDDDLRVREVRDGIHRHILHGPEPGCGQTEDQEKYDEAVPRAEFDDAFNHCQTRLLCLASRISRPATG